MATKKKQDEQAPQEKPVTKNGLRNQAERIILERHREEYHIEAQRLFAEHDFEYTRRSTPEERAAKKEAEKRAKDEAKLEALLAASPHLREKLAQVAPTHAGGNINLEGNLMDTGAVGA